MNNRNRNFDKALRSFARAGAKRLREVRRARGPKFPTARVYLGEATVPVASLVKRVLQAMRLSGEAEATDLVDCRLAVEDARNFEDALSIAGRWVMLCNCPAPPEHPHKGGKGITRGTVIMQSDCPKHGEAANPSGWTRPYLHTDRPHAFVALDTRANGPCLYCGLRAEARIHGGRMTNIRSHITSSIPVPNSARGKKR